MDHDLAIEKRVRDGLLRLAKDLQIPLLATNDSHYVDRADAPSQEHLLCINSGSTMDIPAGDGPGQRFAFTGDGYYLKSAAEMRELWVDRHGLREACDNTLLVAERCDVTFTEGNGTFMPRFPCPPGEDETSWLLKEVESGPAVPLPGRHHRRAPQARGVRARRDHPDGLQRLLPRRGRLHQLGQGQRHPGRTRAAARDRARSSPMPCGSPTSTRWSTACCSSGSSTPTASRCPTSTSTSTSVVAARSSSTSPTSTARTASR